VNVPSKRELGIPEGKSVLIMQGAGLNIDRGVEEAIAMMRCLDRAVLLLVGDGDIIPAMKERVKREELQDRVLFFPKRPYAELMYFTFHADLGLSLDQPTNPNYEFSLPNKVFDYIHATTPVICSNVVEVAALVRKYDLGIVLDDYDPQHMAAEVGSLLRDERRLLRLKENCRKAAELENWERETEILKSIYPDVR
jgi:glycosyltransferase involved in cell wall biosynthesis